jgi:GalNAc-alpha-(1->4)-GalNAc-alpha-(1->3)-diNAcBac-PP-undecaprenol alpha-1,4-N-acetyl-D-galactosaminyltransferase
VGEGPERPRLEAQIRAAGLEERVRLCGWIPDPASVLRTCDAFVLSSRFEGFPNALLEAMALGLPAISVDCPSGPADIIRHEVDGLLVPFGNVPALAAAIRRLLSDGRLRGQLGAEAVRVVERFSTARYFALWDAVLRKEPTENVERT